MLAWLVIRFGSDTGKDGRLQHLHLRSMLRIETTHCDSIVAPFDVIFRGDELLLRAAVAASATKTKHNKSAHSKHFMAKQNKKREKLTSLNFCMCAIRGCRDSCRMLSSLHRRGVYIGNKTLRATCSDPR
jgi:hypothetical protein